MLTFKTHTVCNEQFFWKWVSSPRQNLGIATWLIQDIVEQMLVVQKGTAFENCVEKPSRYSEFKA